MSGPDKAGYWEAMKAEILTLIKLKAWKVVLLTPEMNVLDSTWAFKCKGIQMVISGNSKQGSVLQEINKFMELITLVPLHQWFLGLQ